MSSSKTYLLHCCDSLIWGGPSAYSLYICIVLHLGRKMNWSAQLTRGVHLPLVSICFYMHWYFLIFSYKLTVLNGLSLTALKSKEFTLCSGSFEWGVHLSGVYMHWYFLIFSYKLTVSNGLLIDCIEKQRVHSVLWQF